VVASGRSATLDDASLPGDAIRIAADLRDPDECRRLVREAARRMGGIDIVVNNAAVLVRSRFRDLELEDMDTAWAVNLRAPALIMQESFVHLSAGRSPAIVNVVSTAGVSGGIAPAGAYGMTKAGLIVLTKAVAREYGPHGIRVFALSPPTLDSQMQRSLPEAERARVAALNVLGRPATHEETARFALLTASGLGSLVAGTMIDLSATAY
jgi:NAD(P)-dependent dehydrogenase (short-subunit alcohol dehydrogenase family)